MMSGISIVGHAIQYEFANGTPVFDHLDFSFGPSIYGLVGMNGIGKTTLLKLISQELRPTGGSLKIQGSLVFLPQIFLNQPAQANQRSERIEEVLNLTQTLMALRKIEAGEYSQENLDQIGNNWDLLDRIQLTFDKLGISHLSLDRPFEQLSGGERVKVHVARILLANPDIAILDEPTNNLDSEGRAALYDFIRSWNKCMLVVSHDRELLDYVDTIVELSNQGLQYFGGNYEFYLTQRELEHQALKQDITTAEQERRKRKKDLQLSIERQTRRMAQGQRLANEGSISKIAAGGLRRKAEITLAKSNDIHQNRLNEVQAKLKTLQQRVKDETLLQIDIPMATLANKKELFQLRDFNFRYQDSPHFLFKKPLTYTLRGPTRIQIAGPNGSGKSTLVRLLLASQDESPLQALDERSEKKPFGRASGEIIGKISLKIRNVAYLDQNTEILGPGDLSLLERFSELTPHLNESDRRIRLGRFSFNQKTSLKKISSLSGGERMRGALACILFSETPSDLIILDEPTNNLDLESVEQIEKALNLFRGGMIVVSHDSRFLEAIGVSDTLQIS